MSQTAHDEAGLREQLVAALQRLDALGLNRGSTGNLSHRLGAGMLITPTGMGADELRASDLVWLGDEGTLRGDWQPSSEWHFHRAIYAARPDLNAVVHTHSVNATALACLERGLPAFHYMVAVAGGDNVPCTAYHTFGSEALSHAVAQALGERKACLLAHHGVIAAESSLPRALALAVTVEELAQQYILSLALGTPPLLDDDEIARVLVKFRSYGQQRPN